jgi:hypothetical protein
MNRLWIAVLITLFMLSACCPEVQAKRKKNNNTYIIQDNRTSTERTIDRSNAQVRRNRSHADSRSDKIMNRAYSNANKSNRRMQNNINRILRNSNPKSNKRRKYRTRKYF